MHTVFSTNSPQDSCGANERLTEPVACRGSDVPKRWADVTLIRPFRRETLLAFCAWAIPALAIAHAQQPDVRFGGVYSELGDRRQQLINNWVARFTKTTGQQVEDSRSECQQDPPN